MSWMDHAIKDWTDPNLRDDIVAAKAVKDGLVPGVEVEFKNIGRTASFTIGTTHIWMAYRADYDAPMPYWQIADLLAGMYVNHRGFSDDLEETIDWVLSHPFREHPSAKQIHR
jgi:hypothetical protein